MQFFYKNSHDWCDSVKMTSVPSLFSISLRYVKPFKIFVFLIFLFWIGVTFFSVLQLGPRNGGLLVPISISKYEDLSISQSGSLQIYLDTFQTNFSLKLFPGIFSSLQTEKDILDFLVNKNKFGINENIVFRIDGRALPSGEGDIILLPSNYGTSSTVNGIELSEILCLIMEFPCKNRLVLIDVMAPWNNIGHGGLLWDLGLEINKTLDLAKSKFKNKHGISAENINFHLWSASGEGSFSRQLGVSDSLFYDQIYFILDNLINKKLSGFTNKFTLNNISKKVISEVNKKSVEIFGVLQNSFFVGWGKGFPVVSQNKILQINDSIPPFIWPEEYSKAWFSFNQLRLQNGFGKNPKVMFSILSILLDFQFTWINSHSDYKILKAFNSDVKYFFDLFADFEKNNDKLSKLVSIDVINSRFTDIELKKYRVLFNSIFGNLKTEKDESLIQSLKSKEFITAIEKLSSLELEFLLLDSIIESTNFNIVSVVSILDFIYKHHKDLLAIETVWLNRFVNFSKIYLEFKDFNFCKLSLRSHIECNKLFYVLFKNELMFKGMRKAMDSLDKGDWLLEHGGGGQLLNIISFYEEAETTSKVTFLASKSLEKAVTLFDGSIIELFHATETAFPATVVLFPVLDSLEKLGKYVLKCELDMEGFPTKTFLVYDDKNINDNLSEFIYITDTFVSPFEKELSILKRRINDQIIPALLDNSGHFSEHSYLSGKLGSHLLVFSDNKNLIKMLDFIAMKVNGLNEVLHSLSEDPLKNNFDNEAKLDQKKNLTFLRYNLVLVNISLMRSIGLDVLADKLSNALKKVDSSQSRSKSWNDLIKLLPKLYYSELTILESSLKFPVLDRLSYIFRKSNFSLSYDSEQIKTKQRLDRHLIMVENVLSNRFQYGLDGDYCLRIIKEIGSYSLPLVPVQRFVPLGDMSVIVIDNNKYDLQREFSFRGLVQSRNTPKIEVVEKTGLKFNSMLNDVNFENVPGSQYYKITGKINISRLKNDSMIVPFSSSLVLKIVYDLHTDYFNIPVLINTNKPELEILFRKINGDLVEDNFKARTLSDGEKYTFFVRNNSLKPREAYVKITSGVNKLFLADSKVVCPENQEVAINFKSKIPSLKPDAGFSFDFSNSDKISIEVSDNLKPDNIYQQRLFNPSIIDPTDYLLVEDAKYYPSNLKSSQSPSIRLNLRSLNNNLLPQPFVDLSINQFKTPGFKSGTGAISLFLKPKNSVELFLKDLVFDYNLSDKGEAHLNIDNFKRCYRYGFNINPFGSPYSLSLLKNNEIRFSGEFKYSDQKILTFPIETDGGSVNSTLEIGLWDDSKTDEFPKDFSSSELHTSLLSVRNQHFNLSQKLGEGVFSLFSFVDDWNVQWDVSGSSGKKVIHAIMKDDKGGIMSMVSKKIVIDFSPPKLFNFHILSDVVIPGKNFRFSIFASDQGSGISKISSSYAKNGSEKTVLIDIPITKNNVFPDQYIGSFLVPLDLKSPFDISITVLNGQGKSTILTKTIQLSGTTSSSVVTSIKGVVKEGGRLQPGLVVTLYDAKSKKSKVVTSNENGVFLFENLEPLSYKISVEKISSSRTATNFVDLKLGQTVDIVLELLQ